MFNAKHSAIKITRAVAIIGCWTIHTRTVCWKAKRICAKVNHRVVKRWRKRMGRRHKNLYCSSADENVFGRVIQTIPLTGKRWLYVYIFRRDTHSWLSDHAIYHLLCVPIERRNELSSHIVRYENNDYFVYATIMQAIWGPPGDGMNWALPTFIFDPLLNIFIFLFLMSYDNDETKIIILS